MTGEYVQRGDYKFIPVGSDWQLPCWAEGRMWVDVADLIPLRKDNGKPLGRHWFGRGRKKTMTLTQAQKYCDLDNVVFGFRTGRQADGTFVVVADCDVKNGIDGPANFMQVMQQMADLTHTPAVALYQPTPSGGVHYFFGLHTGHDCNPEADYRNRVSFVPGVDLRGQGGFVRLYTDLRLATRTQLDETSTRH